MYQIQKLGQPLQLERVFLLFGLFEKLLPDLHTLFCEQYKRETITRELEVFGAGRMNEVPLDFYKGS